MGWGAAIGGIAAGLGSFMGQSGANRRNTEMAREQMAFQERMSNTAVQRRMEDLRMSGINPLLAGKFDASSPTGAMATMQNALGAGVTSAMQAAQLSNTIKKTKAEVAHIKAATGFTKAKHDIIKPSSTIMQTIDNMMRAFMPNADPGTIGQLGQELLGAAANSGRTLYSPFGPPKTGTAKATSDNAAASSKLAQQIGRKKAAINYYRTRDMDTRQLEKELRDLQMKRKLMRNP